MKLAVINTLPVPSGQASVNRILSYSKGLVELGVEVEVFSSGKKEDSFGEIYGVKYRNCGGDGIIGLFTALNSILKAVRKGNFDVVFLVSNSLLLIYPLWVTCRLNHIKLLQEKSEFPFVLMKKGFLHRLYAKFYVNTTYRLFDGLIVMTKPLMEFFKDKVRKNCRLFEMPMTVDTERFVIEKGKDNPYGDYIAYCGNMTGNKDGVLNLIDSFSKLEDKFPNIKLLLIGGTNKPEQFELLKSQVKEQGIKNIVFYGRATREEMPELLVNAKLLALARPTSLQSTGGFPTKLGEYLATGNPIVVTKVGDIPNYLNDSNAYLVEPDDNNAFANAISEVFKDYPRAVEKGLKGKELALNVFNSRIQSERLKLFLQTLI